MNRYVLDACALIAYNAKENGGDVIRDIFAQTLANKSKNIYMSKVNLLEVYYHFVKKCGESEAGKTMRSIREMPIEVINGIDDDVFEKAGILKSKYKVSLADSVALAESMQRDAFLVTSDHHEFEAVGREENVKIKWFR